MSTAIPLPPKQFTTVEGRRLAHVETCLMLLCTRS